MRRLLITSCTVVFATAASFAPHPAQAMTIATPAELSTAIQQSDVKQNVYWRRGYWGYSYYRPYAYTYPYRPYAYAYRPYAYSYAYRPYAYGRYAYRRWW
jgi:hypothetical protein